MSSNHTHTHTHTKKEESVHTHTPEPDDWREDCYGDCLTCYFFGGCPYEIDEYPELDDFDDWPESPTVPHVRMRKGM